MSQYEITVRGIMPGSLADELAGFDLTVSDQPVVTVLSGSFDEQESLHAVLHLLEGLGIELIELRSAAGR